LSQADPEPSAGQGPAQAKAPEGKPGPGKGKPGPGKPGPGKGKPGPGPGPGKGKPGGPPPVVEVRPIAKPVTMKRRHWGLIASFVFLVLLPLGAVVFYMWAVAVDQYSSRTGFTVRQEESTGASDLIGGLAQFAGGTTSSDTDVLYEFIQSQEIVQRIDAEIDLVAHYSSEWPNDPVFALWPSADIEDLLWYWRRVVRISYDKASGLIDLQVLAYDPQTARAISRAIVGESQRMINQLNEVAREDAMRYATRDLEESLERLKTAREALTQFRTRTQIVDPETDLQGRMGVMSNLQQQLAEALIEYDLLRETANSGDPRVTQARRRIEVIRERIGEERESFASAENNTQMGGPTENYPSLIAEYESLTVDREFAEETYRAALAAVDVARANASRQSRYLATYVSPTLPQSAQYPQRFVVSGLAMLFLFLAWGIMALVYYSIRDRR
jgi:capsular polysaccharide transport system permease protein